MRRLLFSFAALSVATFVAANSAFAQAPNTAQGIHADNIVLTAPGGNTLTLFVPTLSSSKTFDFPDFPNGSSFLVNSGLQSINGGLAIQGINPFMSIGDPSHAGSIMLYDANAHTITLKSVGDLTGAPGTNYNFIFPTPSAGVLTSDTSGVLSIGGVTAANGGTGLDGSNVNQNLVLASPVTGSGAVNYRALVARDIPNLNARYIANSTTQQDSSDININGTLTTGSAGQFSVSATGVLNANTAGSIIGSPDTSGTALTVGNNSTDPSQSALVVQGNQFTISNVSSDGDYIGNHTSLSSGTSGTINLTGIESEVSGTDDTSIAGQFTAMNASDSGFAAGVQASASGAGTNLGAFITSLGQNGKISLGLLAEALGDANPTGAAVLATASTGNATGMQVEASTQDPNAVPVGLNVSARGGSKDIAISATGIISQKDTLGNKWEQGVVSNFGYLESQSNEYHVYLNSQSDSSSNQFNIYNGIDHTISVAPSFSASSDGTVTLTQSDGSRAGTRLNLTNAHGTANWTLVNGQNDAHVTDGHLAVLNSTGTSNYLDIDSASKIVTVNNLIAGSTYGDAPIGYIATVGTVSTGNGLISEVGDVGSTALTLYNDAPGGTTQAINLINTGSHLPENNFAVDWAGDISNAGTITSTGSVTIGDATNNVTFTAPSANNSVTLTMPSSNGTLLTDISGVQLSPNLPQEGSTSITGSSTIGGNIFVSTETETEAGDTVTVTGNKTFVAIDGTPGADVGVTVTNGADGQVLYLYNRTTGAFNLSLGGRLVPPGATATYIYFAGAWH